MLQIKLLKCPQAQCADGFQISLIWFAHIFKKIGKKEQINTFKNATVCDFINSECGALV